MWLKSWHYFLTKYYTIFFFFKYGKLCSSVLLQQLVNVNFFFFFLLRCEIQDVDIFSFEDLNDKRGKVCMTCILIYIHKLWTNQVFYKIDFVLDLVNSELVKILDQWFSTSFVWWYCNIFNLKTITYLQWFLCVVIKIMTCLNYKKQLRF